MMLQSVTVIPFTVTTPAGLGHRHRFEMNSFRKRLNVRKGCGNARGSFKKKKINSLSFYSTSQIYAKVIKDGQFIHFAFSFWSKFKAFLMLILITHMVYFGTQNTFVSCVQWQYSKIMLIVRKN